MSYTIEVYQGRQKAEWHLGIYALYVMFFPDWSQGLSNGHKTCCLSYTKPP